MRFQLHPTQEKCVRERVYERVGVGVGVGVCVCVSVCVCVCVHVCLRAYVCKTMRESEDLGKKKE